MLLKLPNILTPDEVTDVTALLASAPWTDGRASAGEQAALVKNNQQLPHACEAAQQIRAMVLRGLDRSATFFSAALPITTATTSTTLSARCPTAKRCAPMCLARCF
jgi:PKHD-type hydroxylase